MFFLLENKSGFDACLDPSIVHRYGIRRDLAPPVQILSKLSGRETRRCLEMFGTDAEFTKYAFDESSVRMN